MKRYDFIARNLIADIVAPLFLVLTGLSAGATIGKNHWHRATDWFTVLLYFILVVVFLWDLRDKNKQDDGHFIADSPKTRRNMPGITSLWPRWLIKGFLILSAIAFAIGLMSGLQITP